MTGSVGNYMAAIVYRKGLIAAEQYHDRITAENFPWFIHENFAIMFKKYFNPRGMLFFYRILAHNKIAYNPELLETRLRNESLLN